MSGEILHICLCMIVREGQILLLRRNKDPYRGLLALPGGKIEFGETPQQAALRETEEETCFRCSSARVLGCATEHIVESGVVQAHFVMIPVQLENLSGEMVCSEEGELCWVALGQVCQLPDIIPTDREMIGHFLFSETAHAAGSVPHFTVEKNRQGYCLKSVE